MVRIAKEKAEVVQPKAAAVAVDEAAAQAKVKCVCLAAAFQPCNCSLVHIWLHDSNWGHCSAVMPGSLF